MILSAVFLSIGAIFTLGLALYYNLKILENFWSNRESSMAAFFLRDEIASAFKVLAVAQFLFSFTVGVSLLRYLDVRFLILRQSVVAGAVILLFGFLYFFRVIAIVTSEYNAERKSGDLPIEEYLS